MIFITWSRPLEVDCWTLTVSAVERLTSNAKRSTPDAPLLELGRNHRLESESHSSFCCSNFTAARSRAGMAAKCPLSQLAYRGTYRAGGYRHCLVFLASRRRIHCRQHMVSSPVYPGDWTAQNDRSRHAGKVSVCQKTRSSPPNFASES